jgi:hypothetical protein
LFLPVQVENWGSKCKSGVDSSSWKVTWRKKNSQIKKEAIFCLSNVWQEAKLASSVSFSALFLVAVFYGALNLQLSFFVVTKPHQLTKQYEFKH